MAKKKAVKKNTKKNTKNIKRGATTKAAKKTSQKTSKKTAKKVAKKTAKKVAKKVAKKAAKKVAKKVAKKTAKKVAKKTAKKAAKKVAKKVAKKTAKKVAKKVAKKTAKKKSEKTVSKAESKKKSSSSKIIDDGVNKEEVLELEEKILNEISELSESFDWEEIKDAVSSLEYFVDKKSDECGVKGCEHLKTTLDFCRLHYISNWKNIQRKKDILREGKLQEYVEELSSKYPPKYLEAMLTDLSDDKEFFKILDDLQLRENFVEEDVDVDDVLDEEDDDITVEARDYVAKSSFDDEEAN